MAMRREDWGNAEVEQPAFARWERVSNHVLPVRHCETCGDSISQPEAEASGKIGALQKCKRVSQVNQSPPFRRRRLSLAPDKISSAGRSCQE
jgi:hypothetical protein